MKNKKVIIAIVSTSLVVVLGVGGIFVNAQIQEKEASAQSEALAESERLAESAALGKAEQEKEAIEELESLINALYVDDSKKLLSTDISQDKIKGVETLLTELENAEFSSENTVKLNSLIVDFTDVKNMFSITTSLSELTIEGAFTDEGTKKIEEIQKVLNELKGEKPEFVESLQATLDTLKSDIDYISNVKASVRSLFSDDTYSTVVDGITRDTFLSVVSLKDGIGVESIRLELEERLVVVSNYLDQKDAEAAKLATQESSSTTSSNGSSGSSYSDSYSNGTSTYTEPTPTYEDTSSSYVESTSETPANNNITTANDSSYEWSAPDWQEGDVIVGEWEGSYTNKDGGTDYYGTGYLTNEYEP